MKTPRTPPAPAPGAAPAAPDVAADWPEGLLEVGHVLDAWGTRGWIKVAPDDVGSASLLRARTWWLQGPRIAGAPGAPRRLAVRRLARPHGASIVALLDGCDDRDHAERLKGWTILLRREDFPPPDEGEFYWADLIGCEVLSRDGAPLGRVEGLLDSGAQSVLRLRRPEPDTPERLIPFVGAYIVEVDLAQRRIVADWQPDYD